MKIKTLGVVGAGTMGNGIAQVAAVAGCKVILLDVSEAALEKGLATLTGSLERLVTKGKLDISIRHAAVANIQTSTEYGSLDSADLVIEAATETADLKLRILGQIESVVSKDTIVASNTSSISITSLGSSLRHPERFIGMHFFNPVPMMSLVEIIRGLHTSDTTVQSVHQFSLDLGKTPISVRNSPGFVVNRILVPMINEAFFVLSEGVATAEEIDSGMRLGASHPLGPLALADLIGLDVCLSVMDVLQRDLGDPKYRASPLLREYVAAGWLGRKVGRGVFDYTTT
jgi:3-hydroxybutyryl-CoA dehydrogenase